MPTLYQITGDLMRLQGLLEEFQGETTPELEALLDGVGHDLEVKAKGYCQVIANLQRHAEAMEMEEHRLAERREATEKAVKRLKDRLLEAMTALGIPRIDAELWKISIRKNAMPTIKWMGTLAELPFEYQRVKIEPDLQKARDDLKAGKELPSQFSVQQGSHLRID